MSELETSAADMSRRRRDHANIQEPRAVDGDLLFQQVMRFHYDSSPNIGFSEEVVSEFR